MIKSIINKISRKKKSVKYTLTNQAQCLLTKLSTNLNKPLNKPTSIIISVTPNCPLRCRQCDIWKSPPTKPLTLQHGKLIIDKLYQWLGEFCLNFTGGEPFLDHDLLQIIKYAENKGIITHINTNGFLIDRKLALAIIDSNLSVISFSIDSPLSPTHDYLRGVRGTYQIALKAIRYLQKNRINHPKIYINSVIMDANIKNLDKLVLLVQKEKIDGITFQALLPNLASSQKPIDLRQNSLWPKNTRTLIKNIDKIIAKSRNNKIIHSSSDNLKIIKKYYINPNYLDNIQCFAGINNFIIDQQGNIRLCFSLKPIGNIFRNNPKDVWINQKSQRQRQIIRQCHQSCKIITCNRFDNQRLNAITSRHF
jgi:MoaA/NifB/PqqE/SkfB family radical SAM enzyme